MSLENRILRRQKSSTVTGWHLHGSSVYHRNRWHILWHACLSGVTTYPGCSRTESSDGGAAILRQHVFPLEVQADAYILVLQQLETGIFLRTDDRLWWLRVFMIQAVEQCIGNTEVGIQHEFRISVSVFTDTVDSMCPFCPIGSYLFRPKTTDGVSLVLACWSFYCLLCVHHGDVN